MYCDKIIDVSVIVPLHFGRRSDLLSRAKFLALNIGFSIKELIYSVICDDNIFKKLEELKCFSNLKIIRNFDFDEINLSKIRNRGIENAVSENLILLDVDIFWNKQLFNFFLHENIYSDRNFDMLPCLYLNALGSKKILKGKSDILLKSYFDFSRKYCLHLAVPSSIVFIKKTICLEINGFDESYVGYGYEDLDFLLRYKRKINPKEFFDNSDAPSLAPLLQKGFRAELAEIAFDNLINKKIAFHLFHEKIRDEYIDSKLQNKVKFEQKFHQNECVNKLNEFWLMQIFFEKCQELNKDFEDYLVLLDARPRHLGRINTFYKKIKFLFANYD